MDKEGTYVWSDGTPWDYSNWNPGQPNNSGNEDCFVTNFRGNGLLWNDNPCESLSTYVCKEPPAPEPIFTYHDDAQSWQDA